MPGGRRESKTSVRRLDAVEKERQALELRKAGVTFDVIAQRLGYAHPSGAYRAVMSGIQKTLQQPADELRQLELARLDAMLTGLWTGARQGNHSAVMSVLRIMERRAKLLGLDAPTVIEWRKAAQEAGLDPVQEFERMVNYFTSRLAGEDGGGRPT
jgi:hypothetical protein